MTFLFINFFLSLNIQFLVYFLFKNCTSPPPLEKGHLFLSLLSQQPPSKNLKQKGGADYAGIPSPLFSHFLLHESRYAHVLESLFNKVAGTVAVLLTAVFFSPYLTSLYKFKNLKRTAFKI